MLLCCGLLVVQAGEHGIEWIGNPRAHRKWGYWKFAILPSRRISKGVKYYSERCVEWCKVGLVVCLSDTLQCNRIQLIS